MQLVASSKQTETNGWELSWAIICVCLQDILTEPVRVMSGRMLRRLLITGCHRMRGSAEMHMSLSISDANDIGPR